MSEGNWASMIYLWLYKEQLLLGLVFYTFFASSRVVCSPSQSQLWLFLSHCLFIDLMGNPHFSFMAYHGFSGFGYRMLLFSCPHFATWLYNQIDRPSLGVFPMHSVLWYPTILFDIFSNLALFFPHPGLLTRFELILITIALLNAEFYSNEEANLTPPPAV